MAIYVKNESKTVRIWHTNIIITNTNAANMNIIMVTNIITNTITMSMKAA